MAIVNSIRNFPMRDSQFINCFIEVLVHRKPEFMHSRDAEGKHRISYGCGGNFLLKFKNNYSIRAHAIVHEYDLCKYLCENFHQFEKFIVSEKEDYVNMEIPIDIIHSNINLFECYT